MIVRARDEIAGPDDLLRETASAEEAIDRWLDLLMRLMKLPDAARQAVRDELAEHLHDRVRDLMLAGAGDTDAVRAAIEELGEAADLARRLESANRPDRRRLWMNLSMLGLGAAVVTLGIMTVSPNALSVKHSVFEPSRMQSAPPASFDLKAAPIRAGMPLADALTSLSRAADAALIVRWGELGEHGIDRTSEVLTEIQSVSVRRALDLVVDSIGEPGTVSWSYREGAVEVGVRELMDRRDIALISYDVTTIVELGDEEPMTDVILNLVEPNSWIDNGGDLAQLHLVGTRMFVEAPARMHERIQWILGELLPAEETVLGPDSEPGHFSGAAVGGRGFGSESSGGALGARGVGSGFTTPATGGRTTGAGGS